MTIDATYLGASILIIVQILYPVRGDMDTSICNTTDAAPSPPPALAESYTADIEWKWLERNATIDVTEVHDGILKVTSQTIVREGQKTLVLYDHKMEQYVVYRNDSTCLVKELGTYEFLDNHVWLSELGALYNIFKRTCELQAGEHNIRSIPVVLYQTCLYLYQSNITVNMQLYFSASKGWAMALSNPAQMVPVRFVVTGSIMHNDSSNGREPFTVIGDIVNFNPLPTTDVSLLQLPPGAFCEGRKSGKPINPLAISFSAVMEILDLNKQQISFEYIWFDHERKLVRRDYKPVSGRNPDPTSEVFDFNIGVHYSMNPRMGNCNSVTKLRRVGDLFVVDKGNGSIRMQTSNELFHAESWHNLQYVGLRSTRGVICDVWVRKYLDTHTNKNYTVEWYFATQDWQEGIDVVVQPAPLMRMDIWQGPQMLPIIHNVQQWNTNEPQLSTFNVQSCYPAPRQTSIVVHFVVINNASLLMVSKRYLRDILHTGLTGLAQIPLMRITDTKATYSGTSDLFFTATLLDKSPVDNTKLYPNLTHHDLDHAYDFLRGSVESKPKFNLTSTTNVTIVQIQGMDIRRIDGSKVFSTTTTTTTISTPEQTPSLPTHHPTTAPQLTPSEATPPLPPLTTQPTTTTTTQPTTTTTQTTTTKQTTTRPTTTTRQAAKRTKKKTSNLGQRSTAWLTKPCTTSAPCTCPNVTCPTPNTTHRPVTCPPSTPPIYIRTIATQRVTSSTTSRPVSSSSKNTNQTPTAEPLKNPPPSSSSGLSGGVVAAIAITMVIVGIVIGIVLFKVYETYFVKKSSDQLSFANKSMDKYMDDDRKY